MVRARRQHVPVNDTSQTAGQSGTLFQSNTSSQCPTLLDLFTKLPSPPNFHPDPQHPYYSLFAQLQHSGPIPGMVTSLYQYQKNTVTKMLTQELYPPTYPPGWTESSVDSPTLTGSFPEATEWDWHTCGKYHLLPPIESAPVHAGENTVQRGMPIRGGVLCEDMGMGKTCECLALILLTKDQTACPLTLDTPVSDVHCGLTYERYLRELPATPGHTLPHRKLSPADPGSSTFSQRLPCQDVDDFGHPVQPTRYGVPTLRYLALHTLVHHPALSAMVHHWVVPPDVTAIVNKFPPHVVQCSQVSTRSHRQTQRLGVSTPTNVPSLPPPFIRNTLQTIHPGLLDDINHTEWVPSPPADSVSADGIPIYLSSTTLVVVPRNLLVQWTAEIHKHTRVESLKHIAITHAHVTIPPATTLIQHDIVLIDHQRFGQENTKGGFEFRGIPRTCQCPYKGNTRERNCVCPKPDAQYISPLLQVVWKRIIVDEGHVMSAGATNKVHLAGKLLAERRWICTGTPAPHLASASLTSANGEIDHAMHAKASNELDLGRLGTLCSTFLKIPPFCHQRNAWSKLISRPFREGNARAIERLTWLLKTYFVRNRPEDIDREVTLPPLQERVVTLDFTYHQCLTYNVLLAGIISNAVLSERVGSDYLFHSSNAKFLRRTIDNIWSSCSWFTGLVQDIPKTLEFIREGLERADKRGYSMEDVGLLKQCSHWLQRALACPSWCYLMYTREMGYYLDALPNNLSASNLLGQKLWPVEHSPLVTDTLVKNHQESSSLTDSPREMDLWTGIAVERAAQRLQSVSESHASDIPSNLPNSINATPSSLAENFTPDDSLRLRSQMLRGCTNSKLSYLISQLQKHTKQEKCIVFVNSSDDLYYVYEGLQLSRIPTLVYHHIQLTQLSPAKAFPRRLTRQPQDKAQVITTFNTSEYYRVIIMPTRLAAFGIDLSTASRIYFMSPVWQRATERQAVKRAHRIGQRRPVCVETLVLRDSLEEELLKRKRELFRPNQKSNALMDDSKLRSVIGSAKFVEPSSALANVGGDYNRKPETSRILCTETVLGLADKPSLATPEVDDAPPVRIDTDQLFDCPIPLHIPSHQPLSLSRHSGQVETVISSDPSSVGAPSKETSGSTTDSSVTPCSELSSPSAVAENKNVASFTGLDEEDSLSLRPPSKRPRLVTFAL
ncbi:hypothetical protein IWQ62_001527 [Dispira parvispora]|uniref:Helicase C-terminal domain-containing protein n=1 Tax=Dispira parvispora TaxID=1520584 RepID=A0A9W8AY57_9FUNG|nr:hypothetical protein IWQ62_001527 [Dispira parvispora]